MDCDICARFERTERGENPFMLGRTTTGYIALADSQYLPGYTIFAAKRCVAELHELPPDERSQFLHDMAEVAHAVFRAFTPRKLNYELLGNGVPHMHWHLFPRRADEPHRDGPVWKDERFRAAMDNRELATDETLVGLKSRLIPELERADLVVERWF